MDTRVGRYSVKTFLNPELKGQSSVLIGTDGSPRFWPAVYIELIYRRKGKSPETVKGVLRALMFASEWAEVLARV